MANVLFRRLFRLQTFNTSVFLSQRTATFSTSRASRMADGMLYRLRNAWQFSSEIKEEVDSPISFSPQQDRFAFVRLDIGRNIFVDGLKHRRIERAGYRNVRRKRRFLFVMAWPGHLTATSLFVRQVPGRMMVIGWIWSGLMWKRGISEPFATKSWSAILQVAWQDRHEQAGYQRDEIN